MPSLTEMRGKASVCGCSSMVEQKLPKLPASAENVASLSKTPQETSVSFQTLGILAQNSLGPLGCNRTSPTTTHGGA